MKPVNKTLLVRIVYPNNTYYYFKSIESLIDFMIQCPRNLLNYPVYPIYVGNDTFTYRSRQVAKDHHRLYAIPPGYGKDDYPNTKCYYVETEYGDEIDLHELMATRYSERKFSQQSKRKEPIFRQDPIPHLRKRRPARRKGKSFVAKNGAIQASQINSEIQDVSLISKLKRRSSRHKIIDDIDFFPINHTEKNWKKFRKSQWK